jgi:hypothetical protein
MTAENPTTEPVPTAPKQSFGRRVRAFLGRDDVGDWWFLLALVAGAVHRGWFVFYANPPSMFLWSDMLGYVERAARLADPRVQLGPFDAFYPPGTHVLLAPFFYFATSPQAALAACESLWFFLAVLTLVAVGLIANRLFKHALAAFVAVNLVWTHWAFSVYTGFFTSETPFAFFMCASLLASLWARELPTERHWGRDAGYAGAGLLAGIAASIRPQFFIQAVLMGLPLIGLSSFVGHVKALVRKGSERPKEPWFRWREAIALGVMFTLPCVATMKLNSHAMGKPWGMSGNAGLNFYQGHCDVVQVHMEGMWVVAPPRIQRMLSEKRDPERKVVHERQGWDNKYFFNLGRRCIRKDSWLHLKRISTNVLDLFATTEPWPSNQGEFRKVTALSNTIYCYALFAIVPIASWLARRRWAERWLLLQLACALPVGILFYGDPRYRIPYDIFGMLLVTGIVMTALKLRRDETVAQASGPASNDIDAGEQEAASGALPMDALASERATNENDAPAEEPATSADKPTAATETSDDPSVKK